MSKYLAICLYVVMMSPRLLPAREAPPALPAPGVAGAPPAPGTDTSTEEPPEGYYAFVESPNATPPRVRPPPYRQSAAACGGARDPRPHVSATNLCGDLNRGLIPRNPMGQNPMGEPYPFELLRNQTLRFLSRALPVLRADDTLPRVAHLHPHTADHNQLDAPTDRDRRSLPAPDIVPDALDAPDAAAEGRDSRKFCDGGGIFCMLYRAINGESGASGGAAVRREDPGAPPGAPPGRYEGPPTPCPARVEYATPVFARNYQGVWRYVVQIPYEGYFTQTVEVTRCMQSRCHYLDGGCLSSPRWLSLLVAELHYPELALQPASSSPSPPQPSPADFQNYQQYLQKRAGESPAAATERPAHCDGHDDLGCFQVRLYYDWFLVPGSCKCWRPDYFARYVRRNNLNPDL